MIITYDLIIIEFYSSFTFFKCNIIYVLQHYYKIFHSTTSDYSAVVINKLALS